MGEHHVGVLLLCNFGDREYLDLLGRALAAAEPERRCRTAPASRSAPPTRRCPRSSCGGWRCARCSAWRAPAPTPAEGSGEIGLAFATGDRRRACRTTSSTRYFAAAYEAAHEAVYNCLVAARPAERLDGTMQDAFPLERVRGGRRRRDGERLRRSATRSSS